jgi:agmatinase
MDPIPNLCNTGDLVLLGLPADDKSSFMRGPASAPPAIRAALASDSSNLCSENGLDLGAPSGADGSEDPRRCFMDAGDLELHGRLDLAAIEAGLAAFLSRGASVLCLGGDHAVSYPALRAQAARFGRGLTVLHIDAHPDLYDVFRGDRLSHACPFARALEEGLVGRLVQVGIRGMNPEQRAQAKRFGAEVIDMDAWSSGKRPEIEGDFYLSLDLDGLDPAFAPGVSHREPGGLSTREAIDLIRRTGGRLIGADLVEYNPARDWDGLTAMTAAKLVKEIAGRILSG